LRSAAARSPKDDKYGSSAYFLGAARRGISRDLELPLDVVLYRPKRAVVADEISEFAKAIGGYADRDPEKSFSDFVGAEVNAINCVASCAIFGCSALVCVASPANAAMANPHNETNHAKCRLAHLQGMQHEERMMRKIFFINVIEFIARPNPS
jgi:hypothetical protein